MVDLSDTPLDPPTSKLFPFQPIALAPEATVLVDVCDVPEMSGKSADVPYTSFHIFPSEDVAIVERAPLPTAIHLCPGATVFAEE